MARTEGGTDAKGRKFAKYSKSYVKEKGQSEVDLTFSGEMLADIELLNQKNKSLKIGYESDYDGLGKVEGNVLGTYGNTKPVTKGRNFLGITKTDLNAILKNYPLKDKAAREGRVEQVKDSNLIAREILKNSGFDIEEQ